MRYTRYFRDHHSQSNPALTRYEYTGISPMVRVFSKPGWIGTARNAVIKIPYNALYVIDKQEPGDLFDDKKLFELAI